MKVHFIVIGKTTDTYILPGLNDYNNRLKRYCNYTYEELPGVKLGKNTSIDVLKKKEGEMIMAKLNPSDFLVTLDEKGKQFSSEGFGEYLASHQMRGTKTLVFLVGGAYGFSPELYERADAKMALSLMTFTHQMVRLIFSEQLYRSFTIVKGEKYHH